MQQQIDQPRRLLAPEQVAKQLVLLRTDAGKARDRRKQWIEQKQGASRAFAAMIVMPDFKSRISLITVDNAGSSPAMTEQLIILAHEWADIR